MSHKHNKENIEIDNMSHHRTIDNLITVTNPQFKNRNHLHKRA